MDKLNLSNKVMHNMVAVVISFLLVGSCATPQKEKQDPFFDKWKTKAETSKGVQRCKNRRENAKTAADSHHQPQDDQY
jgi:hypothetical protein